jgi:hypothetical protein
LRLRRRSRQRLSLVTYNQRVSEAAPMPITAATRYCAVYGHPVHHSASPAMQNAGLAALGMDWKYLTFDDQPDNLRPAIAGAKAMKFISDGEISTLFRHQSGRYSGAL